jgi:hypothetical protein
MKWTASKLRPRVWGDHVSVDVAVDGQISIIAALAAANHRVAMLTEESPLALDVEELASND